MRAAIFSGPHAIEVGERPDPVVREPTDAVVRVVLSCVCGSDLWYYRGESPHDLGPIGHEFIGIVEDVSFVEAEPSIVDEVDEAYRAKYRRYAGRILNSVLTPEARSATMRLVPRPA